MPVATKDEELMNEDFKPAMAEETKENKPKSRRGYKRRTAPKNTNESTRNGDKLTAVLTWLLDDEKNIDAVYHLIK